MDEIKQLAEEFRSCQKLLTAIGQAAAKLVPGEARPGRMNSTLCLCSFGCTGFLRAEK